MKVLVKNDIYPIKNGGLNVGIVSTWFERGAAYVSKQFEEILHQENNVFVYARGGEKYEQLDPKWNRNNVTWGKKVRTPFAGTLIDKKDFKKWIRINKIEIVIFNEQHWWPPVLWCNEMGVKTVSYIDYYTEETIPLFDAYDMLICNTKKHFQAFEWHNGAIYIPWGTNVEVFSPVDTAKLHTNFVKLFHSCGMNPYRKGTDLLLKSLDKLTHQNFELIVHSQVSLPRFFPELASLIDHYEVAGKLKVITKTVPAPGLYSMGDIYVYPSRLEGIGLTVPEAISSGLGVVVPDCGPMNEFVHTSFGRTVKIEKYFARKDGYYWPQNEVSIESLALVIDELLASPESISEVKLNARKYALENLDWTKNALSFSNSIYSLSEKKQVTISLDLLNKIKVFESAGVKRLNSIAIRFSWIYRLYKKIW